MLSLEATLVHAKQQLASSSDTEAIDAELLLAHSIGKDRSYLYAWPEKELTVDQYCIFESLLSKRLQGEPIAYLLGAREFWSLDLQVTPDVLIPRPDTELLIEYVLQQVLPSDSSLMDMGTGSGAIALALASERPQWHLLATDFSSKALQVAGANAKHLAINNVRFVESNWFVDVTSSMFDLIVSNPPYIAESDKHLKQGDLRFEPLAALASGHDGLDDLREIISMAPTYLKANGGLVLEHGYDQAEAVQALLAQAGFIRREVIKDYGGQERISAGWLENGP